MAGFSIGAVLEKFRISNMIASLLLKPFGNKPENVLLGIVFLIIVFLSKKKRQVSDQQYILYIYLYI